MKESSGELSMTLIVIIAAGVIVTIFAAFWPQINNTITTMWKNFNTTANKGNGTANKGNGGFIVIPNYTVDMHK